MNALTIGRSLAGVLLLACFSLSAWAGPERPSPSAPKSPRADLAPKPLEQLDQQLFAPAESAPSDKAAEPERPRMPSTMRKQLEQQLGPAAQSQADSPLIDVARTMEQVQQRIGQADAGTETQAMQGRILTTLDELLKQAQQQCQACPGACPGAKPGECQGKAPGNCQGNGKGTKQATGNRQPVEQPKDIPPANYVKRKNSGGGADPSQAIAGPDKVGPGMKVIHQPNMEEMRTLMKSLWGELPEREREQMLQLPVEEFLPKYEVLIEQYFQRLSEQQQPPQPAPQAVSQPPAQP